MSTLPDVDVAQLAKCFWKFLEPLRKDIMLLKQVFWPDALDAGGSGMLTPPKCVPLHCLSLTFPDAL